MQSIFCHRLMNFVCNSPRRVFLNINQSRNASDRDSFLDENHLRNCRELKPEVNFGFMEHRTNANIEVLVATSAVPLVFLGRMLFDTCTTASWASWNAVPPYFFKRYVMQSSSVLNLFPIFLRLISSFLPTFIDIVNLICYIGMSLKENYWK